eukprot:gene2674-3870_t
MTNKLFALILLHCAILIFSKRLILTNEGQFYMTEEQVAKLQLKKLNSEFNFMDITDTPDLHKFPAPKNSNKPFPEAPKRQKIMKKLTPEIKKKNLIKVVEDLSNFHNRYYQSETGVKASLWLKDQFEKVISKLPAERKKMFKVHLVPHRNYPQRSVICTMEGKSLKNEVVVIGGHIDSINAANRTTGKAPGADDDASGISTVFESFRILAQSDFTPERSIHFMAYAAEELGLLGSQDVAQNYKTKQIPVHAVLQLDMTGYVYQNQKKVAITRDRFSDENLGNFVIKMIEEYTKVGHAVVACAHGCSDHASWTRAQYRALYTPSRNVPQGLNPNAHKVTDTLDKLDFTRMKEFVKVALAFAVELS